MQACETTQGRLTFLLISIYYHREVTRQLQLLPFVRCVTLTLPRRRVSSPYVMWGVWKCSLIFLTLKKSSARYSFHFFLYIYTAYCGPCFVGHNIALSFSRACIFLEFFVNLCLSFLVFYHCRRRRYQWHLPYCK